MLQQEWVEFKEVKSSSFSNNKTRSNTNTLTLNYTLPVELKNMLILFQHITTIYTLFRVSPATKEAFLELPLPLMMNSLHWMQETCQKTCNPALTLISRKSSQNPADSSPWTLNINPTLNIYAQVYENYTHLIRDVWLGKCCLKKYYLSTYAQLFVNYNQLHDIILLETCCPNTSCTYNLYLKYFLLKP